MDIKQIVLDLCALSDEQEWFEFKENWFQPEALGEYVSALSNAAAFHYKKYAYFIWGVNDTTHEIVISIVIIIRNRIRIILREICHQA